MQSGEEGPAWSSEKGLGLTKIKPPSMDWGPYGSISGICSSSNASLFFQWSVPIPAGISFYIFSFDTFLKIHTQTSPYQWYLHETRRVSWCPVEALEEQLNALGASDSDAESGKPASVDQILASLINHFTQLLFYTCSFDMVSKPLEWKHKEVGPMDDTQPAAWPGIRNKNHHAEVSIVQS